MLHLALDVPMVTLKEVCVKGKDCHCMHLAYAGKRKNYYYYYYVASGIGWLQHE